jgi:hypothetical protein
VVSPKANAGSSDSDIDAVQDKEEGLGAPGLALTALATIVTQLLFAGREFIGSFNDDACYLLKAFRIANDGNCVICQQALLDNPYQNGWPVLLAPFTFFLQSHLEIYRLVTLLIMTVGITLYADLYCRKLGRAQAVLLVAVLLSSSGVLGFSMTLMSEPLYFTLLAAVVWLEHVYPVGRGYLAQGILVAWCARTRSEGIIVLLALIATRLIARRWKPLLMGFAAFLVSIVVFDFFFPIPYNAHVEVSAGFFKSIVFRADYLYAWAMNHLLLFGQVFFSGPAWLNRVIALGLLLSTFVGAASAKKRAGWLGFWVFLGTCGALLFWPYLASRYWLAVVPLILVAALGYLPRRYQIGILSLLFLVNVSTRLVRPTGDGAEQHRAAQELYEGIEKLGSHEAVASQYSFRAHLFGHRVSIPFPSAQTLGVLARNLRASGADALVWESDARHLRNLQGTSLFQTPRHLSQWLARSTLFETVFRNEAGLVVRLTVPGEKLSNAVKLWNQAIATSGPQERLSLLNAALVEVPDFPELRVFWFDSALKASVPPEVAGEAILAHMKQYPHDFEAGIFAAGVLRQHGQLEQASEIIDLCLVEATILQDQEALGTLRSMANP